MKMSFGPLLICLGAVASLLSSCSNKRSFSHFFANISIPEADMPKHNDSNVRLVKIKHAVEGTEKTEVFLQTGGKSFRIACTGENLNRFLEGIGFNHNYVDFLRVKNEAVTSTADFTCGENPGHDLYRYVENGKIYNFVKDSETRQAFLLGCQAMITGFVGTRTTPYESGAFSALQEAIEEKLLSSVNCLSGKKVNPDPLAFSDDTLTDVAAVKQGAPAGGSFYVRLALAGDFGSALPSYSIKNSTSSPCNEDLVWFKKIGAGGSVLMGGVRPITKPLTNKPVDCTLEVTATVGDQTSAKPLLVEIKAKPKAMKRVFASKGTMCIAMDLGEISCKGTSKQEFEATGYPVLSMIVEKDYICALYSTDLKENLRCKYSKESTKDLFKDIPKEGVVSISGQNTFACATVRKGAAIDLQSNLSCWRTIDTLDEEFVPPPVEGLVGNTMIATSSDLGVCWDYMKTAEPRKLECTGDINFANLKPSSDPAKPNIKDWINGQGFNNLTDLQKSTRGGCAAVADSDKKASKIKCWGDAETNHGAIAAAANIKPGSLRIAENRLCYREAVGAQPDLEAVKCFKGGTSENTDQQRVFFADSAIFTKADGSDVRCDLFGLIPNVVCTDQTTKQIGDIFPEAIYWSTLIKP